MGRSHRSTVPAVSATLLFLVHGLTFIAAADNCNQESFQLRSQSDADALSGCSTLTGDVIIGMSAEGSIDVGGVRTIEGSLSSEQCRDAQDCRGLTSLTCDAVESITGHVSVSSLVSLATISLQSLQTIGGDVSIEHLPELTALDLTELRSARSIRLCHNRRLANLSLPSVEFITGEDDSSSFIEIVDLAINKWPFLKIRQRYDEDEPRRLGRLLARDLPNIEQFHFNSADSIGVLEAYGLPHQMAALALDIHDPLFEYSTDRRFDYPVRAIDNLTLDGFGGNLTVGSNDYTIEITTLSITNTTMKHVGLSSITKLESLRVMGNPYLMLFYMPAYMESLSWDIIAFHDNPQLQFSMDGGFRVASWDWGFNTSSLVIDGSPIDISFLHGSHAGITAGLIIESTENRDEICDGLLERASEAHFRIPSDGYQCGGSHYDPEVASAAGLSRGAGTLAGLTAALIAVAINGLVIHRLMF